VEAGETVQRALARELLEELGIVVESLQKLIEVRHDYGEKMVLLDTWCINGFSGEPRGIEGQELAWVTAEQLDDYHFPDANQPIVEAVQKKLRL
jgi:8-oxo-dGTP diphosphatase